MDALTQLFEQSEAPLFHSPLRVAFIGLPQPNGGAINVPLGSEDPFHFLHQLYYRATDRALFDGPLFETFIRVGGSTRIVCHDLGRDDGVAVEITAQGYSTTSSPSTRMIRTHSHRHVIVFDNLSALKNDTSDALAALATKSGFEKRRLYTDGKLHTIEIARPFALNGIGDFVHRRDLMDRAIPLRLEAMPPDSRRSEEEIFAELDDVLPELLHDLYQAVSCALRNLTRRPPLQGSAWPTRRDGSKLLRAKPGWPPGLLAVRKLKARCRGILR